MPEGLLSEQTEGLGGESVSEESRHRPEDWDRAETEVGESAVLFRVLFLVRAEREELARVVGDALDAVDDSDAREDVVSSKTLPHSPSQLALLRLADVGDLEASGVDAASGSHRGENGDASEFAESEKLDLGLDIVNAVDDEIRRMLERLGRRVFLEKKRLSLLA